jgi:uncharacterized damage-inducible protein DinB
MDSPTMITKAYLGDLSDADLLVRPVEGANHIAWQLGHLINSEHNMVEMVCPGTMPALPDGFADKYTKETSASDDPGAFHTKEQFLAAMDEQRAGTLAALENLSDDDLDAPAPESMKQIAANVGGIFSMQSTHWTMHAGQWAVVRRKLGRPPLF